MSKARDLASTNPAPSTVSSVELGYVDGVTSAIQTQMDAKLATATATSTYIPKTLTTTTGDTIYASSANTPARLAVGSTGQVLTVAAGVPSWATPTVSPTSANSTINTTETTTSISFVALTTPQSVTLTTGTKVLVIISMAPYISPGTATLMANMTYDISGATSSTGDNTYALLVANSVDRSTVAYSRLSYRTVTAGSNTFTAKFATSTGATANINYRSITVIDLGS